MPKQRKLNFLKPCPWCGGKASVRVTREDLHGLDAPSGEPRHFVICASKQCAVTARTLAYPDLEKAVRVWNTRKWPK